MERDRSSYWKQQSATVKLQIRSQWDTQLGLVCRPFSRITKGQFSMTRKTLLAALSASFLFVAAQGAIAADAPKAPKLTHGIAVALTDAQKAGNAKDYPTALAAIEKAKAVSSPTPYDTLMINRFAMGIHVGMGDLAAAGVDAEAAADTDPSQIPDADKPAVYK